MDDSIIYRKTRRGATELAATHGTLSHAARRVLILLNGERTLAELADLFGSETVEHSIADLEAQGFARQIDPGEAGETTQSIPTLTGPTLVGDLRPIAHDPPPAARRGSGWITMGLFGAAVVLASGYWLIWRPNHAVPVATAAASSEDQGGPTQAQPQPIVRELPLSGLPAVTVSATPSTKASATPTSDEVASEDTVAIVPASAFATGPASASEEPSAKGRRGSQQSASSAAKSAPSSEAEPSPAPGSPPAGARAVSAQVASAASPRLDHTAVDAPAAEATSPAPTPASERETPAAPRSVPVATTPPPPAAAPAASAPPEQLAALTPPTRPKSAPVQLHPRNHNPPEYPGRALRARILEGTVLARLSVNAEGGVDQVDIVKANPAHVFDDEVKRALSQWTFDPPGHPVDTTVELNFKQ
jgi:TonB family protein